MDVNHAKGRAFNMLFMLWRYETTLVAYRQAVDLAKQMAVAFPEGIGTSHLVEVDAVPPSAETRAVFVEYLRLPGLRHYSVTHEGTGFKAAGIRAIVVAQHTLSRTKCEHAVFSSIAGAAQWHEAEQRKLKRLESAEQIAECLHTLRVAQRLKFGP
jgi:hypothetical protein